ncbi:uncharacterized protein I303_108045 [Kwoniella dejecticola CBS 10117]|uniref:Amine oxidase domain-containing protein n=1 Tax=Kwoniella dejecticola CBS 10117 TaxID=1296121 RepID=A0A1A5ZWE3_9TREE|nr:uncharacterized protein I303_08036 [Kwoniella dejecticola CBS 10117]OBR82122.1 hypothetical protein I303_08036 [Kwoniella dejecticola CBS 10117]
MRVAVIGSGLAGLTTAYLLREEGVEVFLIEKSDKVGFHSQSVTVPLDRPPSQHEKSARQRSRSRSNKEEKRPDEQWVVDVPMRGFQGGYYPLLLALYRHLGIPLKTANYKFSFSSPSSTYFIHSGSSGYSTPSLPSRAWSTFFTLVGALATFIGVAICYSMMVLLSLVAWHDLLPRCISRPSDLTLREFTSTISSFLSYPLTIPIPFRPYPVWTPLGDMFDFFIAQIVLPLFSAVGTMTDADVWSLPVRIVLEYIHLTLGTDHYHPAEGYSAADIAKKLVRPVLAQSEDHLKLSTEIIGLEYISAEEGIRLSMKTSSADAGGRNEEIMVDRVILATQASVAKRLLEGLEDSLRGVGRDKEKRKISEMRAALGKVRYRETIVVTHRDTSILPSHKDRRDLNFLLPDDQMVLPASQASSATHRSPEYPVPYFMPVKDKAYTQATQIIYPPSRLKRKYGDELPVLQTTNPCVPIDPTKVLSISRLERALPLKEPCKILPFLRNTSKSYSPPSTIVHIVGSYAYPGIPLLEGCVGSAKMAAEILLAELRPERSHPDGKPMDISEMRRVVGGVDWTTGKGGIWGRIWRWRLIDTPWGQFC